MSTEVIETRDTERVKSSMAAGLRVRPNERVLLSLFNRTDFKRILFLAGDVMAMTLAHSVAKAVVQRFLEVPTGYLSPPRYAVFYLPFLVAIFYLFQGYQSPDLRRPEKELALIFKSVSFFFLALVSANFVVFKTSGFSRYLMLTWYCLALLFLLGARFGLRGLYSTLWRHGLAQQRALLIGSPDKLTEFQKLLSIQRHQGCRMVGVIPAPCQESAALGKALDLPILGSLDQWEEVALQEGVRLIVLCLPTTSASAHQLVLKVLRRCQELRIDVELYSDLLRSTELNYELDEFSGSFRFYAGSRYSRRLGLFVKAALDHVVGIIGSLLTLGVIPLIGLLIKLEDGGPIFYRREFIGRDGRVQYYFKFRTMHEDADQTLQNDPALKARFDERYKLPDDPRVLRVGRILRKFSLDEFPQFFSLLAGQLTFVGPRVISSEERERYGTLLAKLLSVKPGITGFWQVMGRQETTYEERIQMDMFYIDHWSLWLDLVIIAKTFWKVLRAEGAY